MQNRVVVTGMGVVSPVGIGKKDFWAALRAGIVGIDEISLFDASDYPTRIAAEVKGFEASAFIGRELAEQTARFAQFALVAAAEAISDAELKMDRENRQKVGIFLGTSRGGITNLEKFHEVLQNKGSKHINPSLFGQCFPHAATSLVANMAGARGPTGTVMAACASGTAAIGNAFRALQRGDADIIITGGTEAPLTPLMFAGTCASRVMSTSNDRPRQACRPFDKNRDGFVMGEGAGMVVLETLNHALQRNARIYGEIIGYGLTCDAYHITAPHPKGSGIAMAMSLALSEGKVSPGEVDYLNAHGTSTILNDRCETLGIKQVFGPYAYSLPVSSTKSMTGHLMGAAGAVEFIACLLAMENNLIPPTVNYETPDPDCDLDYVPNLARKSRLNLVMSDSLGFGGHNASLLVKRFTE
ncbi:beta-ketoacyl-ACP synthase II [Desulfoscipio geothermicus]|uniref:3-oxoacyl-[acyl-carrier-protein] synthase 2 n=1 Tax=Desulfoscipio geothermicus DSM 3669 TaxID=1121426 RepID=A0A1I6CPJ8_9FIRM|nr:beta-ketoacyl-ACP synthase II [Desulfoscipio geothermicus]SFQ95072.1 3-oxoacyl-[acyl-carrier-protein] synthase II [Desulfoscipio geothermicus DSM 3669]